MQWRSGGAYAAQVAVAEDALARKPAQVTFEQAACVPTAGLIALANLPGLGSWAAGRRVLINGAGGGVGGMAIQLARAAGAEVTGVDHPRKHELLRVLGAAHVIDYTAEDFTRSGSRYDLVFDVVGNQRYAAVRRVLAPDGTYVLIGHDHFGADGRGWLGSIPRMISLMARSLTDERLPRPQAARPRPESMALLRDRLEDGSLTPVVARSFPLEEVPEAIALLASGRALGRIVVVP
jgi:NADPH:quinone reductase-like Zn-dependent oxidoreductase